MYNEIMLRILTVYKGFLKQDTLFKFKLLSIRSKPTLYSSYLIPYYINYLIDVKRSRFEGQIA